MAYLLDYCPSSLSSITIQTTGRQELIPLQCVYGNFVRKIL